MSHDLSHEKGCLLPQTEYPCKTCWEIECECPCICDRVRAAYRRGIESVTLTTVADMYRKGYTAGYNDHARTVQHWQDTHGAYRAAPSIAEDDPVYLRGVEVGRHSVQGACIPHYDAGYAQGRADERERAIGQIRDWCQDNPRLCGECGDAIAAISDSSLSEPRDASSESA